MRTYVFLYDVLSVLLRRLIDLGKYIDQRILQYDPTSQTVVARFQNPDIAHAVVLTLRSVFRHCSHHITCQYYELL